MEALGLRLNNPLNIRYSPMNSWLGQIGEEKGFCKFDTLEHGYRAALVLLGNYQRKGYDTISKIISRWAPLSENNTEAYIAYVERGVRLYHFDDADSQFGRDTRLTYYYQIALVAFMMSLYECGVKYEDSLQCRNMEYLASYVIYHYKMPKLKS